MANKYHARKIAVNGETFDSQREYNRWLKLRLLERAGMIRDLQRQVAFELIPAQYEWDCCLTDDGRLREKQKCVERACTYVADFVYYKGAEKVVEDAKGVRTEAYRIKRKLMLERHGIRVQEV